MKVLHINTYDGNGGAGRACLRLNKALRDIGIDSNVLVLYRFNDSNPVNAISAGYFGKLKAVFNIFSERYFSKWLTKATKTPFSLQWFGVDISKHPAVLAADVLHIHWVNHGFLRPSDLKKLDLLEKKVVWTFHDSNAFTGGCHVRYDCENYYKNCGNCPLLKSPNPKDLSNEIWKKKEEAYSQFYFNVIAPSNWMKDSVKLSSLMGTRTIATIPNTLETEVFKPYVKSEAKGIFKILPQKFVLLSGFMPSKNDKHKGTSYLLDALILLAKNKTVDVSNIELVVFGNKKNVEMPEFPFKTTFLGTISKDEHLAKCYAAADVFLLPSLEDNLPNTVMESMACGTPVVAFRTGGIPDMINHLENGYLAEYKSAEDMVNGILWAYHYVHPNLLQKEARRKVLTEYSEVVVAEKHLKYYLEV